MLKLIVVGFAIAAFFLQSLIVPTVATVTFQPDTTLTEVVDLLNAHDTWAENNNFTIRTGSGFYYRKDSMSIQEREYAIWVAKLTFAELNHETPDPLTVACVATNNCGDITITQIKLLNPPNALLETSLVTASEAHRDLHPFFYQNLPLGPQRAP